MRKRRFEILNQIQIVFCIHSEYQMDPFVDQNDIVLLDVHYSTRTMVKFRTDVVFGILDLIAAFGGRKEHREQFFCF